MTREGLVVTCAHVVIAAGAGPGDPINIVIHLTGVMATAMVELDGWRASNTEDVAIPLFDGPLPEGIRPLPLDLARRSKGHPFISFGYPKVGQVEEAHVRGTIEGLVDHPKGWPMLRLSSPHVAPGVSGAPVFDTHTGRVVGMISEFPAMRDKENHIIAGDAYGRHTSQMAQAP